MRAARLLQIRSASAHTLSASGRTLDHGGIAAAQRFSQILSHDAPPAFEKSRLNGIARKRHHSQVRNSPWATFFYGVKSTKKLSAAPLRSNIAQPVSPATGGPPGRVRFFGCR